MTKTYTLSPLHAALVLLTISAMTGASLAESPRDAQGITLLQPTLDAHGGLEQWRGFRSFEYRLNGFPLTPQVAEPSRSMVDLRNRYNRIESAGYTLGWNGEQAWVTPGPDAVGLPPRFYSLGSFYFIGMPFVFADPGVVLADGGTATFRGQDYRMIRVRYVDGVGHSDRDDYRIYVDPTTHRLAMIDHSVTETGIERVTWTFDAWQQVRGVLVPRAMSFFPGGPADQAAEDGVRFTIEDARLSRAAADPAIYQPPAGAVITSGAPNAATD